MAQAEQAPEEMDLGDGSETSDAELLAVVESALEGQRLARAKADPDSDEDALMTAVMEAEDQLDATWSRGTYTSVGATLLSFSESSSKSSGSS